jgi:hypothetical protein
MPPLLSGHPPAASGPLLSVGDALRTLDDGAYPLRELYDYVQERVDVTADNGLAPSTPNHQHDPRWRHGVRCCSPTSSAPATPGRSNARSGRSNRPAQNPAACC